jgi:hypothetical protein
MTVDNPRMKRERKTIKVMIKIFCNRNHKPKSNLCKDCQQLLDYALERLSNCPFQKDKPTCKNCVIHCFKEPEKSKFRQIMRFSGPRILFTNPILSIRHLIDGSKKNPN